MEAGSTVVPLGHLGQADLKTIRAKVKDAVYNQMDKSLLNNLHRPEVKEQVEKYIKDKVLEEGRDLPRIMWAKLNAVADQIIDEVTGFGPIQDLLDDPEISEVMVNGPDKVYVERNGLIELTDVKFNDDKHVMNIIDRIVSRIGRKCDEATPMVDARLPDGSRVNAIIPPLSLIGPVLTIRKFSKVPLTPFDMIFRFRSYSCRELFLFYQLVQTKFNILISGGTGSGKTTTLNILSSFIPENERIVTVEDSAELQLQQPHVIPLEARPPNVEGRGQVTIRDLVKNALRMRPDRIVVGEVRGAETLDMLQAMNTGHDGSLTTAHANSARDALIRLETMILFAVELPVRAIRQMICAGIDVIIHQQRLRDGRRRVTEVSLVEGMNGNDIVLAEILRYDHKADRLVVTENRFKLEEVFREKGVELPAWIWGELPCKR
ncbi:MAG: CpaF family protein [Peptococcaceae bacterium]|nr:CpaF family protein [Peptococcaceae bacterium]